MQSQAFNIVLPKELVEKVDKQAGKEYKNRSELIREAVWMYLKDKEEWGQIFQAGKKAGKMAGIKSETDVDKIVYEYRHGKTSKCAS